MAAKLSDLRTGRTSLPRNIIIFLVSSTHLLERYVLFENYWRLIEIVGALFQRINLSPSHAGMKHPMFPTSCARSGR
jgi:hypothetical protein